MKNDLMMLWTTVKKIFTYSGRATRKEYWMFILACVIVNFVLGVLIGGFAAIAEFLGIIFGFLGFLIILAEIFIILSLSVRRLHDIDLSGFWLFYLSPVVGLPLIYIVYLLGIDCSCDKFIENTKRVGSPWLGWILLWLFWPLGAVAATFLLFLYAGKDEANSFGESPYSK